MDYLTNLGKNVGGDLLDSAGAVAKAYLCIKRTRANGETDAARAQKSVDFLKKLMEDQASKINSTSSLANLSFNDVRANAANQGFMALEVQYNPASIRFQATPGGMRRSYSPKEGMAAAGENMVTSQLLPKYITMSFKLIFESINVNDAFANPSENPIPSSIGQAVSLGADMAKKIKNNIGANGLAETYSVRRYMEGFVSLLLQSEAQEVVFYWGKTCFHGMLTRVNSTYKMFNNAGHPIYGEVDIDIRQDASQRNAAYTSVLEQEKAVWYKQYEKAFINGVNSDMGAIDKLKMGYEKYRGIL